MDNEKECLKRISENDKEAFSTLFRYYYPKTITFISGIIKDLKIAEDLSQDIFLKVWLTRDVLAEIENFGSWLYVLSRNAALMHLRKRKPSTTIGDFEMLVDQFIEEQCSVNFKKDEIRRIVDNMPPRRREIFIRSRKYGMSNAEIAKSLGVSKKTVENHLNLALNQIRKVLVVLTFFI